MNSFCCFLRGVDKPVFKAPHVPVVFYFLTNGLEDGSGACHAKRFIFRQGTEGSGDWIDTDLINDSFLSKAPV